LPKVDIFFKEIANGNFMKKRQFLVFSFLKGQVVFGIFSHSNDNLPEGQLHTYNTNVRF